MTWTLDQWVERLPGARFEGETQRLAEVTTFFIDSRQVPPRGLFVPLKGENTDGHRFLLAALAAGALGAFCAAAEWDALRPLVPVGSLVIVVDDPLAALQAFAAVHLDAQASTLRIGITGSNGKTTTKELLAAALAVFGPTYATPGNLNSEIGVPLAALAMGPGFRFAVFEMGINRRGEMDALAQIVRPLLSIITNIGTAHIGIIGSQQQIALEKKKIFSQSGSFARAVLPSADRYYPLLAEGFEGEIRPFGRHLPGFRLVADRGLEGTDFEWKGVAFHLGLPGLHHVDNALAVLTAVDALGLDSRLCAPALAAVGASFGRGQVLRGRVDLLLDCYNANLDSMLGLLRLVGSLPPGQRRVLVLGSMKELGPDSAALHQRLGEEAARVEADALFLFGAEAERAFEAAVTGSFAGRLAWTADYAELEALVLDFVRPGDLVILKGSRSNRLERLQDLLQPRQEAPVVL